MFLRTLFQLGIHTVAPRKSQTEEDKQIEKIAAPAGIAPPGLAPFVGLRMLHIATLAVFVRLARAVGVFCMPTWRQYAPQHPSLSFIHDRSLRYGI